MKSKTKNCGHDRISLILLKEIKHELEKQNLQANSRSARLFLVYKR